MLCLFILWYSQGHKSNVHVFYVFQRILFSILFDCLGGTEQKHSIQKASSAPVLHKMPVIQERLILCINLKRCANLAGHMAIINAFSRAFLKES